MEFKTYMLPGIKPAKNHPPPTMVWSTKHSRFIIQLPAMHYWCRSEGLCIRIWYAPRSSTSTCSTHESRRVTSYQYCCSISHMTVRVALVPIIPSTCNRESRTRWLQTCKMLLPQSDLKIPDETRTPINVIEVLSMNTCFFPIPFINFALFSLFFLLIVVT